MEPVTSWKRRATGAHDLSRRRRWEHLSRATSAMRKLGRVITRGMPSAAPFPRVLPQDPTAGRRLSITAVSPRGHRRTGHYGPLGVHPAGTDVLCCESGSASRWRFFLPGRVGARMLASSAHPYLLDSSRVKQKTEGRLLPNHCRVMMPARASTCDSRRNGAAGRTVMAAIPKLATSFSTPARAAMQGTHRGTCGARDSPRPHVEP